MKQHGALRSGTDRLLIPNLMYRLLVSSELTFADLRHNWSVHLMYTVWCGVNHISITL